MKNHATRTKDYQNMKSKYPDTLINDTESLYLYGEK